MIRRAQSTTVFGVLVSSDRREIVKLRKQADRMMDGGPTDTFSLREIVKILI
jgi:hypothetical protein